MSPADAAALLALSKALAAVERGNASSANSDQSDESPSDEVASVASVASVAAPTTDQNQAPVLLKAVLTSYVSGAEGPDVTTHFAAWAAGAGLTYARRGVMAVALDGGGNVVAAMDTRFDRAESFTRDDRLEAQAIPRAHIHGWARENGVWTCVQDYLVPGFAPETGCGLVWHEEVTT